MAALFLSKGFFSTLANSGTYPVSGRNFMPTKVKYSVPRTQMPRPKGVMPKNPNGVRARSAMALAAEALEPTPTSVTKPPN